MSNETTKDILLEKKLDGYSVNSDNFTIPSEITVTITLNEYRNLLKIDSVTQHKIDEAQNDRWKRESENSKLREEIDELKHKLTKYIYEFGKLPADDEDNE